MSADGRLSGVDPCSIVQMKAGMMMITESMRLGIIPCNNYGTVSSMVMIMISININRTVRCTTPLQIYDRSTVASYVSAPLLVRNTRLA